MFSTTKVELLKLNACEEPVQILMTAYPNQNSFNSDEALAVLEPWNLMWYIAKKYDYKNYGPLLADIVGHVKSAEVPKVYECIEGIRGYCRGELTWQVLQQLADAAAIAVPAACAASAARADSAAKVAACVAQAAFTVKNNLVEREWQKNRIRQWGNLCE